MASNEDIFPDITTNLVNLEVAHIFNEPFPVCCTPVLEEIFCDFFIELSA